MNRLARRRGLRSGRLRRAGALAAGLAILGGCASQSRLPSAVELPPGTTDARARFGELFCRVLEKHGPSLADQRLCSEAIRSEGELTGRAGRNVELGDSRARLVAAIVPGIGYGCIEPWLGADTGLRDHLRKSGYDARIISVDPLSGTSVNAKLIRDAVVAMPEEPGPPRVVLIGYSKGAPDVLDAVVNYPEIRPRVAAVVSLAGAVGGSPLAESASESMAGLFRHFPGATCTPGDHAAVAALRPDVRRQWLAENILPKEVRFYTVATLPEPHRISAVLKPSYRKLRRIDPRNDGQVIAADQIIPGSTVLAFINADHWAAALPIARNHPAVAATLVTDNEYPREALFEAILRFVEDNITGG